MGMREDFDEGLRRIYLRVSEQLEKFWKEKTGNLISGGKINASALPVDGTTITITTGGGGGQVISSGGGTVTNIGVTVPTSVLAVSPSSITGSGTFAFTLATQIANTVWAGPTTGIAAAPTFRGLVPADIPSLDAAKIATGTFAAARLPLATTGVFGAVKPDGTTITIVAGVISAPGGGGTITTQGDLIVGASGGAAARLSIDTTPGRVPGAVGSDVDWVTPQDQGGWIIPLLAQNDLLRANFRSVTTLAVGFFGDSITADTPSGGAQLGNTPPQGTAILLSRGSLTVTALNQGHGGATTADWLPGAGSGYLAAAIAAFLAAGVTLAHGMLGTNDAYPNGSGYVGATYRAHVAAICAAFNAVGIAVMWSYSPFAVIGAQGVWTAGANSAILDQHQQINGLVNGQTILQGDTKAYLYFQAHQSELGSPSDGIHPNATGCASLETLWTQALQRRVQALSGQQVLDRLILDSTLRIVGNVLGVTPGTGLSVAAKGDLQGFSSAPTAVPVSGVNGRVLTEDSSRPAGLAWRDLPTLTTALTSLSDVTLLNLQDGDTLSYSAVLGEWINSSAGFGWDLVDNLTGNLIVDDATGFQVISDPLPTLVLDGVTGATVVDNLTGANVVV